MLRWNTILYIGISGAVAATGGVSVDPPMTGLESASFVERIETRNKILQERSELISDLIALVKATPPDAPEASDRRSTRTLAIELLGKLRAAEAVEVLFENLKVKVPVDGGTYGDMMSPGKNYPAVGSLAEIGGPAVERAWYRVEMSDDPLERELCTWIIKQEYKREVAAFLLDRRIENADPLKKARYEAARALLNKSP